MILPVRARLLPLTTQQQSITTTVGASIRWACNAATGGDIVGFKEGITRTVPLRSTGLPNSEDGINNDCSDGLGNSYNPNWREQGLSQPAARTNWVKFVCADGESTDVVFGIPNQYFYGGSNGAHAEFAGGCFHFGNMSNGNSGDGSLKSAEYYFHGINRRFKFEGQMVRGGMDIEFRHWEYGPFVICGDQSNSVVYSRCNPNGPAWEAKYAQRNISNSTFGSQVPWIGRNKIVGGGASINVGFFDGLEHDISTRDVAPMARWLWAPLRQ